MMRDPAGFGGTDYFATVYTDIDAHSGQRHLRRPQQGHADAGALSVDTSLITCRELARPYRVADSRFHGHHQRAAQRRQ